VASTVDKVLQGEQLVQSRKPWPKPSLTGRAQLLLLSEAHQTLVQEASIQAHDRLSNSNGPVVASVTSISTLIHRSDKTSIEASRDSARPKRSTQDVEQHRRQQVWRAGNIAAGRSLGVSQQLSRQSQFASSPAIVEALQPSKNLLQCNRRIERRSRRNVLLGEGLSRQRAPVRQPNIPNSPQI
jgi:hypothetical protein